MSGGDITRRPYRGPYRTGSVFPEMVPLRAMMDRLLENALTPTSWGEGRMGEGGRLSGFGMDVEEDDNAFYVRAHLPGVRPEDVNVQFHDNVLTIGGEYRREPPEGRRQVVRESSYGQFQRQVTLGTPVDPERAEATYEHGVLEIKLPKSESVRPRTIPVRGIGASGSGGASQLTGAGGAGASAGSGSMTGTSAATSGIGGTGTTGTTGTAGAAGATGQSAGSTGAQAAGQASSSQSAGGGTRRRATGGAGGRTASQK